MKGCEGAEKGDLEIALRSGDHAAIWRTRCDLAIALRSTSTDRAAIWRSRCDLARCDLEIALRSGDLARRCDLEIALQSGDRAAFWGSRCDLGIALRSASRRGLINNFTSRQRDIVSAWRSGHSFIKNKLQATAISSPIVALPQPHAPPHLTSQRRVPPCLPCPYLPSSFLQHPACRPCSADEVGCIV